jgi:hypothetical protein
MESFDNRFTSQGDFKKSLNSQVMINNSMNINKFSNNQLSPQLVEHKKKTIYHVGNPGPGIETRTQMWQG